MSLLAYRTGKTVHADATEVKSLSAEVSTSTRYSTLGLPAGTAYQVAAAKIFYITRLLSIYTTANGGFKIGYGDTAVTDSAAAPTNFVALTPFIPYATATIPVDVSLALKVPTGKYPCILSNGAAAAAYAVVEGYEAT